MNETYTTIHGNAVEDPVRRLTHAGDPYVTFRLASTESRRRGGSGEFYDVGTSFFHVRAFHQLARNVDRSVRKGQPVIVHGRLRLREWIDGDRRGTSAELEATSVGTDLRRGTAVFTRVTSATRDVTPFGGPGGDGFQRPEASGDGAPAWSSGSGGVSGPARPLRADAALAAAPDAGPHEDTADTDSAADDTDSAVETAAPKRLAG